MIKQLHTINSFLNLANELTYPNNGVIVTASGQFSSDQLADFTQLSALVTPTGESEMTIKFTINPLEQTVSQNVDLSLPPDEYDDNPLSFNLSVSDSFELQTTFSPTQEQVTSESDVEYMTYDEFLKLKSELGIGF